MEQSYYRIGEVSRATGLSKDTLHFYDKIGLLCPEHVDPRNGYRYYSLRNLWQLDIIAACRKLNIPLDTVRQILSLQDNAQIVDLLMEYRQEALRRSAYYQLQTFFFIPLMGLQQVIVPVLSFNHSAGAEGRVRETLRWAVGISGAVMAAATAVFLLAPQALLRIFSASPSIVHPGDRRAGIADHLPQLPARRRCHDAHRLFPGHRPERAEPLCHRAAAGGAAGAPGLGVPLRRADVCLADLPGDRGAVGALRTGFLPEDALPVKTPKCRIIF